MTIKVSKGVVTLKDNRDPRAKNNVGFKLKSTILTQNTSLCFLINILCLRVSFNNSLSGFGFLAKFTTKQRELFSRQLNFQFLLKKRFTPTFDILSVWNKVILSTLPLQLSLGCSRSCKESLVDQNWESFRLLLTRNTKVVEHKLLLVYGEIKCSVTAIIEGLPVINSGCLEEQYQRPRFSQE